VPAGAGEPPRILVEFGTGQATPPGSTAPAGYASAPQGLYGIWDWNLAAWNRKGSARYASLAAPQVATPGSLLEQTVRAAGPEGEGLRLLSSHRVCWRGGVECAAGNPHLGWFLTLPGAAEQVIYSPVLQGGALIVDTTIPPTRDPLACTSTAAAGWTLALSPASGGALAQAFFGDPAGRFLTVGGTAAAGLELDATGSPALVTTRGPGAGTYLVVPTAGGGGAVRAVRPQARGLGTRLSWSRRR
jgi:type IV pilus assembly protein PilY1